MAHTRKHEQRHFPWRPKDAPLDEHDRKKLKERREVERAVAEERGVAVRPSRSFRVWQEFVFGPELTALIMRPHNRRKQ